MGSDAAWPGDQVPQQWWKSLQDVGRSVSDWQPTATRSLGDIRKVTLADARKIARQRFAKLALPPAAMDIIRRAQRRDGAHIFSRRGQGFRGWAFAKMALDRRIHLATGKPLAPWRIHDIRRTFRTGLSRIGIAPHVAERAINHARGGIEAVYDKHRYEAEVKGALERWANHVTDLISAN
jgi:hypothetical protein